MAALAQKDGESTRRRCGPYVLVEEIGRGTQGVVHRAVRMDPAGAEVCVKVVDRATAQDPRLSMLFQRESEIAARLQHPNIVGFIQADAADGWIALELVRGLNLRALLRSTPSHQLQPDLATLIAAELCKAFDYLHSQRGGDGFSSVVHRDVTSSNVLISLAGAVKLADFGLARLIRAVREVQTTVRGTYEYMSPEQARGGVVDARSDLFSLGVLLYEVLAGRLPVQGLSLEEIRAAFTERDYPPLKDVAPHVPAGLVAIVERLMHPAPEQRFPHARACLRALSELARREVPVDLDLCLRLGAIATAASRSATLDPTVVEALLREHRVTVIDPDPARSEKPTVPVPVSVLPAPSPSDPVTVPAARPAAAPTHHDLAEVTQVTRARPSALPLRARAPAVSRSPNSLRRVFVGATLLAGVGVAGAWTTTTGSPSRPVSVAHVSAVPAPTEAAVLTTTAVPPLRAADIAPGPTAPSPPAEDTPTPPALVAPAAPVPTRAKHAVATAELTIGAIPPALVWIDRKSFGWSPVVAKVAAGRHAVAIGADQPGTPKWVVVRSGEKLDVFFGDAP